MQHNIITIDLEFEQPFNEREFFDSHAETPVIIQVGWTISDISIGKILKTDQTFVKYDKPLSSYIKKLTHIRDEDVNYGVTIYEALNMIIDDMQFYNTSRIIREWGFGDVYSLKNNVEKYVIDNNITDYFQWPFGQSGMNVKHMYMNYAIINNLKYRCGLAAAITKCGLIWEGRGKHQAGVDSLNTARIYQFLFNIMSNNCNKVKI